MSSFAERPRRLGEILLQRGYINREQLQEGLEYQRGPGKSRLIGEILVEKGFCTDDQVMECLAAGYGAPYAKLDSRMQDPDCLELLPREYIEQNLVLPLFCIRGVLTVAEAVSSIVRRSGTRRCPTTPKT